MRLDGARRLGAPDPLARHEHSRAAPHVHPRRRPTPPNGSGQPLPPAEATERLGRPVPPVPPVPPRAPRVAPVVAVAEPPPPVLPPREPWWRDPWPIVLSVVLALLVGGLIGYLLGHNAGAASEGSREAPQARTVTNTVVRPKVVVQTNTVAASASRRRPRPPTRPTKNADRSGNEAAHRRSGKPRTQGAAGRIRRPSMTP